MYSEVCGVAGCRVCVLLLLLMVHALKCPYCPASHLYPAAATTAAAAATAAVRWDDVLTFELRWSRELRYPDRLIVHRKGTPGWQVIEFEPIATQLAVSLWARSGRQPSRSATVPK